MLVLALPLIACSSSIPIYDAESVPMAAVFAGWYGHNPVSGECIGGLGSTHWNDGLNTGVVRYVPEKGYYCSSDSEVVSWQLEQMENAGISVLLYSWLGWGDGDLDGIVEGHTDQFINQSLTELLKQIRDSGRDMKVVLVVEPFTATQASSGTGDESAQATTKWPIMLLSTGPLTPQLGPTEPQTRSFVRVVKAP